VENMIKIYRESSRKPGDDPLNYFNNRISIEPNEIVIRTKSFGSEKYIFAQPTTEGSWAFGGNLLYSSNSAEWPYSVPIKLHDRNLALE